MNRQKFIGQLVLALALVLIAALAGQLRRWERSSVSAPHTTDEARQQREQDESDFTEEAEDVGAESEESAPEVMVRFRAGVSEERIQEIAAEFNDRVEDEIESVGGLVSIDDLDGDSATSVAEDYSGLPEVEYVEEVDFVTFDDPQASASATRAVLSSLEGAPNDPLLAEQWALINTGQRNGKSEADISALAAWKKTRGSDDVVVAVLDSGVDYTHPDLLANMWTRPAGLAAYRDAQLGTVNDLHGFNAADKLRDPMDDNGHGTHCAGIIGAEGNNGLGITGINWKVKIMPLKFMSAGGFGTTKDAIEAINYVIARKKEGVGVRIISASWGSTRKSKALEDVIRKAGEEGILFVAASGNSTADTDRRPHYPSSYNLPNVLSVAALNRRDELADFSNFGLRSVHIAAPGAEIMSTWLKGDFQEHSGTSMATPYVSGVAALVLANDKNLSVEELKARLLNSVDKLDSLDGKVSSGGRVNAARAVGALR